MSTAACGWKSCGEVSVALSVGLVDALVVEDTIVPQLVDGLDLSLGEAA